MSQRRSTAITIRVSVEEREILERFAAAEKLAVGTALRRIGLLAARKVVTDRREPTGRANA